MQGNHQYMSLNLMGNQTRPASIPDELESFFHVLVNYSVLYLRSDCPDPDSWLNIYFFSYCFRGICGGGRREQFIKSYGYLCRLVPEGPLLFDSPLDRLLIRLIRSFQAHYEVLSYEFCQARSPSPSASSSEEPLDPHAALAARNFIPKLRREDDPELAEYIANLKRAAPVDDTPTEEVRRMASRVADHSFALEFIDKLLRREDWPDDDRMPQRPPSPAPTPTMDTESESESEESTPPPKRRRQTTPQESTVTAAPTRTNTKDPRRRKRRRTVTTRKPPVQRRKT